MPKMTNPETGETQEISMEEFMKMMRSGNGSLQQVVTNADGTTSTTTLYGNAAQDGLDHSVNIFVDDESFNAFLMRAVKRITGKIEDEKPADDSDDLYEMIIDFTDSALMGILRSTDEELTATVYTRDERKATFEHLKQASKTWKVNPDKTISFSGADLEGENKTISLYMLAFVEMRKFLRKTGKLEELKKLGNCGSGVILKATDQADDAQATIVRGKNRPDLPCNMFLLGEQMMRPYMDEMMTDAMMSSMSIEEKIEAAENGDPDCMESLAQAYLNGDEVNQDFEKSAYWWEKLAETGNAIGQFNIGLHYAKGCGVQRNLQKAVDWMNKAAENGDEDAPHVSEVYNSAICNMSKAENGDAVAQAEIAKFYMEIGGSLEQYGSQDDFSEAFKWAKKSADQGNLDGLYDLALCYEHGRGTAVSKTKAAMYYEKAAKEGHAPSQWNLAVCYLNGSGYERNEAKGWKWAYESAAQEYELAVNALERQGRSVPQIIEKYKDPEVHISLDGTQYEGRADRCENIKAGDELQYKIVKDNRNEDSLECFYRGGSVGLISSWSASDLIALLKLDKITLQIKVKSCVPKSQRGARARNANVQLDLIIREKKPETEEERRIRVEAEKAAEEKVKREAEEKRRQEKEAAEKKAALEREKEEKRIAEEKQKEQEQAQINAEVRNNLERDRKRIKYAMTLMACSMYHVVAVKPDGTVIASGKNDHKQCEVSKWRDIIAVDCDESGTIGLTKNGRVLYTGWNVHSEASCTSWSDIIQIAMSESCVFGLKKDGTVVATPKFAHTHSEAPDVTNWRGIKEIRRMGECIVGIDLNGNAQSINRNYYGKADRARNFGQDVIDAAVGDYDTVITLKKDGSAGAFNRNIYHPQEILKVYLISKRALAILSNGRVLLEERKMKDHLDRFVEEHKNERIIAVSGSYYKCAFLTENGKIYVCGRSGYVSGGEVDKGEPFGTGFQLFDSFDELMANKENAIEREKAEKEAEARRIKEEKEAAEKRKKEEETQKAIYREKGVCQHCGGTFKKGIFFTKCALCGKKKDY